MVKRKALFFLVIGSVAWLSYGMEPDERPALDLLERVQYEIGHAKDFTLALQAMEAHKGLLAQDGERVLDAIVAAYDQDEKRRPLLINFFAQILSIGKSELEPVVQRFIDGFNQDAGIYGPFIKLLKHVYPDKYVDERGQAVEGFEPVVQKFVYVPPSREVLHWAGKWQEQCDSVLLSYMNKNVPVEYLCVRGLSGKTIPRLCAEEWKYCKRRRGYSWRVNQLCNRFVEMLVTLANSPDREVALNDVMECFYQDEVGYSKERKGLVLVEIVHGPLVHFKKCFPRRFEDYKRRRKSGEKPVAHRLSPEQRSALYVAQLFHYVGSQDYTNAKRLVQAHPSLVNACYYKDGQPILYHVLRRFSSSYGEIRKRYAALFEFLLANGAPYTTEAPRWTYVAKVWQYGRQVRNQNPWVQHNNWPSVEAVLRNYRLDPDRRVGWDDAQELRERLTAFRQDPEAPFKRYPGLRSFMPIEEKPEPDAPAQKPLSQEELKKMLARRTAQPTFWQRWKPTFMYFVKGAAVGGISWWLVRKHWNADFMEKERLLKTQKAS